LRKGLNVMDIVNCEQYVLNELKNTQNELMIVKQQLEQTNYHYNRTYYRLFDKRKGYLVNFSIEPDDTGKFSINDLDFDEEKDKAILFEVINDNHLVLNDFIEQLMSTYGYLDITKKEADKVIVMANQLEEIVGLLK